MPPRDDQIVRIAPNWIWNIHRCIATDYAVNFAIEEGDPAIRNQLIAAQTASNACRVLGCCSHSHSQRSAALGNRSAQIGEEKDGKEGHGNHVRLKRQRVHVVHPGHQNYDNLV
jgi:hypothetical protein